ncbi:MAG: hypothetical protein JW820_18685 [Spirochaetales bacterium]|nr:hypothetical protein [Spirochaetales bacterium]
MSKREDPTSTAATALAEPETGPTDLWLMPHQDRDPYPVPREDAFKDEEGEQLDFIGGADLGACAYRLIDKHSTRFGFLGSYTVVFRWRAKGGKNKGKPVLGRCQKTAGLLKDFSKADFVIWAAADHCQAANMTFRDMEALVFHELCHAGASEDDQARVEPHDFEGFVFELQEYGAWTRDLRWAAEAFRQPTLFEEAAGAQG